VNFHRRNGSKYYTRFHLKWSAVSQSTQQTTKAKAMEVGAEFLRQLQRDEVPARKGPLLTLAQFAKNTFLPFIEKTSKSNQQRRRAIDMAGRF
jgi:L-lactate utilization protein LutC